MQTVVEAVVGLIFAVALALYVYESVAYGPTPPQASAPIIRGMD